MKVYYSFIYLNSTGRRRIVGAFTSWKAFSEVLGVSVSKACSDGCILDRGTHFEYALDHPEKAFEVVDDPSRGMRFVGYIEIKSHESDKFRHRRNRGHGQAVAYIKKNDGVVVVDT